MCLVNIAFENPFIYNDLRNNKLRTLYLSRIESRLIRGESMFREMRRKERKMEVSEAREVMFCGSSGVLAVQGDEGFPYAVPVSYTFADEKIYFHCATEGHKIESMKKDPKVSFCVVERDNVIPGEFTTDYRSAIAFGTARIVEEREEKIALTTKISDKYSKGHEDAAQKYISSAFDNFVVVEITIEQLTGKKNK